MDCFLDFCLSCDNQSNGAYCSQTCRLADLEKASTSAPTSPMSPSAPSQARMSWQSTTSTSGSAFVLPPAYNFSEKVASQSPNASTHAFQSQTSYFMRSPAQQSFDQAAASQRALTPSSSRTSLSSTMSDATASSSGGISHQARLELEDYFSSFHQAKAAKRRPS
ncbi:hypothetical protein LTR36_005249 [Oleoguttula mirabilis]|uniref:Uncharacterized protein n=1 Tax=Oleoguttula mirabilis TaxID=1507867 RepID=A0AAV9JXZ5_9PEZI|nr:hypothetical protein LTR36_005249 [Oleoguttula mirabilis]